MENTVEFLGALGVNVVKVDDLGGDCAVWSNRERTLTLCASLCRRQKSEYVNQVLAQLGDQHR